MLLRCPALLVFSNKIQDLAPIKNAVVFRSWRIQHEQGGGAWGCDTKGMNDAASVTTRSILSVSKRCSRNGSGICTDDYLQEPLEHFEWSA
jgi:hypothetical protein